MVTLERDIKNLIDSLKYQITRLETFQAPEDELEEAISKLEELSNIYNKYVGATGENKKKLEKQLLSYIKAPATISFFKKWNKLIAGIAAAAMIGVCSLGYALSRKKPNSNLNEPEYTATFIDGDEMVGTVKFDSNEQVYFPSPEPEEGREFIGWLYEDGSLYTFGDVINNNVTLTAKWESLKFTSIEEFESRLDAEKESMNLSASFNISYKPNSGTFTFYNIQDFLKISDLFKYNSDLFETCEIDAFITPDNLDNLSLFPNNGINYKLTFMGDFKNLSLASATSNLNLSNITISEGEISPDDLEYFLSYHDLFVNLISPDFQDWDKISALGENSDNRTLGLKLNNNLTADYIALSSPNLFLDIPAGFKDIHIECNAERMILNLSLNDVIDLTHYHFVLNKNCKSISINLTLPENYTENIFNENCFVNFIALLSSPDEVIITFENTDEIYTLAKSDGYNTFVDISPTALGLPSESNYQGLGNAR